MGRNHARVYAEMNNADLVAVAGSDEMALRTAGARYHAHPFADYREMLESEQLDATSVAVPSALHYEVAVDVIRRGVSLVVE